MKTLLLTTPQAKFEAKAFRELVPDKLTGWHIETSPSGSLNQTATIPHVTLVQLSDNTRPAELKAMFPRLAHIQAKSPNRSYVLFSFKERGKARLGEARAQKRRFHDAVVQINRGLPTFPNPQLVNVTFAQSVSALETELDHISAKLDLPVQMPDGHFPNATAPRPSPLDRVKEIVKATEDLRAPGGKLSATAVASGFGVSLSQLAGWLGRSRQALNKTPDAASLQDELAFFERVARLRAVVPKEGFLKWLRMPTPELDGKAPLDLLARGERQAVADLVDDLLTGAPA